MIDTLTVSESEDCMRIDEFKHLCTMVERAGEHNPVWWSGWLFLNLTRKQVEKLIPVLESNPVVKVENVNNQKFLVFPSGLRVLA